MNASERTAEDTLRLRVVMPDEWRDSRMEFPADTSIAEVKTTALPELLRRSDVDPSDYYVEYFEKEVLDETRTLADLDVSDGAMLSIRGFDLDHPRPFEG